MKKDTSIPLPGIVTPCLKCKSSISVTDALLEDFADDYNYVDNKGRVVIEFLYLPLQCPKCNYVGTTLCIAEDDFYHGESSERKVVTVLLKQLEKARKRHKKKTQAD
jgi:hypothetical protein